jgi:hypothetical protein
VVTTETGEEHVEEHTEEVEEEVLLKYVPKGNHKWYVSVILYNFQFLTDLCRTTFEVDSSDSSAPTLKVRRSAIK